MGVGRRGSVMSDQLVLVVEDDPHFGRQLIDLFEFLGYRVELATSGTEGVEQFEALDVDFLLTDLMLPGMSGVEVVKCVRGLPGGEHLPVMMMSAIYKNPRLFEKELRDLDILGGRRNKAPSYQRLHSRVTVVTSTGGVGLSAVPDRRRRSVPRLGLRGAAQPGPGCARDGGRRLRGRRRGALGGDRPGRAAHRRRGLLERGVRGSRSSWTWDRWSRSVVISTSSRGRAWRP